MMIEAQAGGELDAPIRQGHVEGGGYEDLLRIVGVQPIRGRYVQHAGTAVGGDQVLNAGIGECRPEPAGAAGQIERGAGRSGILECLVETPAFPPGGQPGARVLGVVLLIVASSFRCIVV
jgi:hypothetical protein